MKIGIDYFESSNSKENNIVIECIYKYESMYLAEFNEFHVNDIFDELFKQNNFRPSRI